MKLVTRVALGAALVAALAACKKDDKKSEPAAKEGTAAATAAKPAEDKPAEPAKGTEAMAALKGAMAKADAPKQAMPGLGLASSGGGGGMGGIGAALGGLFGGGGGARAAAPAAPSAPGAPAAPAAPGEEAKGAQADEAAGGDIPPEYANVKLPPPAPKGGDCEAVATRIQGLVVAVMEIELAKLGDEERKLAEGQIQGMVGEMKQQMKDMCESQKWPQELKDCVLTAPDMGALQQCEQYVTEEMKQADMAGGGDEPEAPDEPDEPAVPVAAVPAWTGGDDCKAVGERVMQVAMANAGSDIPEEFKAEMEKAMAEAIGQITSMCTSMSWSAEQRGCFFKAGTMDAMESCFSNIGM